MIQWYITKFFDYKFLLQNSGFRWPHTFIQPILQTFTVYLKGTGGLGVRDWGHALINAYHKIVNSQHGVHGEILSFFLHSI